MKGVKVRKSGKNMTAMIIGPFWYINKRMFKKGFTLLLIVIFTLGAMLIPGWVYNMDKADLNDMPLNNNNII